jgi:hypothetical protein
MGGIVMEDGTLSIVKRDRGYQVRYAANDPRAPEHQPYACPDEATLVAVLLQLGTEPEAITQAWRSIGRKLSMMAAPSGQANRLAVAGWRKGSIRSLGHARSTRG